MVSCVLQDQTMAPYLRWRFISALFIAALCSIPALLSQKRSAPAAPEQVTASTFAGEVVGISDGDTIRVMHNGRAERIRLYGIDCPESYQAFGTRAKQFTSSLAFGKTVTVHAHDVDR